MRAWVLAFLFGVLSCQYLTDLPSPAYFFSLFPLCIAAWYWPFCRLPLALAAGFFWAAFRADLILSASLPETLESRDIEVIGHVVGLPEVYSDRTRFEFDIDAVHADGRNWSSPGRVRLNWYQQPPELLPGQQWQLTVRLKRPHSYMNPDGFDYESWLLQRRLRALGYVRAAGNNRLFGSADNYSLDAIRLALMGKIQQAVGDQPVAGLVLALAIGARQQITDAQWETMRRTGTNHLMAISGLHIGFVAFLTMLIVRWVGRFCAGNLPLWLPLPYAAAVLALLTAGGYAMLAGFAIPTQRAFIMVAIGLVGLLYASRFPLSYTLAAALFAVLLWDPLAVLSPGFWLSFGAVAFIFYGLSGRLSPRFAWLKMQWWIFLGLIPLLLAWFSQFSLISPLINPPAIAFVVFVIIPLILLGTLLITIWPVVGAFFLQTGGMLLGFLWHILDAVAQCNYALWVFPSLPLEVIAAALFGVLILLLPNGFPARVIGIFWLLPALLWTPPRPSPGELWFTVLDVDQGLSAIVQTSEHTLVYDTGVRFRGGSDMAQRVVIPFLQSRNIQRIDQLIISHGDNDHAGGADSLLEMSPDTPILTSAIDKFPIATPCKTGQHWQWDTTYFEILHPTILSGSKNNRSCVLKVSLGETDILLPGDIEESAEYSLLARDMDVEAEILLAPHHGSRSSSTTRFVNAVSPAVVIFTAGYRNRYGFPKPDVVMRYAEHGAQLFNTAEHGAIHIRLNIHGITRLNSIRQRNRRYWHTHFNAGDDSY